MTKMLNIKKGDCVAVLCRVSHINSNGTMEVEYEEPYNGGDLVQFVIDEEHVIGALQQIEEGDTVYSSNWRPDDESLLGTISFIKDEWAVITPPDNSKPFIEHVKNLRRDSVTFKLGQIVEVSHNGYNVLGRIESFSDYPDEDWLVRVNLGPTTVDFNKEDLTVITVDKLLS